MQQNLHKNKNISSVIILCTLYLLFTSTASAAELYFGIGEKTADGSRDIAVMLRSSAPINALEGKISVVADGEVLDLSDAGSPVQFWIEQPHLSDAKDKITFAGIIPGGFAGEGALFYIHTQSLPTKFLIDKQTVRLLLNDGAGTADIVQLGASRPLPSQFVLPDSGDDKTAPRPFTPEKALLPTESGDTESLVFTAQDDESGIARYEIAYSPVSVDPNDSSLVWEPASNPFVLPHELGNKFIYVKAIDRAGNVRISEVSPSSGIGGLFSHPIWLFFGIITIVCALSSVIWFYLRRRTKHVLHND